MFVDPETFWQQRSGNYDLGGCWADRPASIILAGYPQVTCGEPAVTDLGLCGKHREEIVGEGE